MPAYLVLGLASLGVCLYLYTTPGLFDCYWRFEDCDFCYSVAALRYLDGSTSSGFVDQPGYPMTIYLGWVYELFSAAGWLSEPSFAQFSSDPDPLLAIKEFVLFGWIGSSFLYVLMVLFVFRFVCYLTGSVMSGTLAGLIALLSPSLWHFLFRIRPELLSALLGYGAFLLILKGSRSGSYGSRACLVVGGISLTVLSALTKLNALPLVVIAPLLMLFAPAGQAVSVNDGSRRRALTALATVNLLLAGPTGLVIVSLGMDASEYLLFVAMACGYGTYILMISFLKLWRDKYTGRSEGAYGRYGIEAVQLLLMVAAGWQLAVFALMVRPDFSIRSVNLSVIPDLATSLKMLLNPRIAMTYMAIDASVWQTLSRVAAAVVGYFSPGRITEVIVVCILIYEMRKRRSPEYGLLLLLLGSGLAVLTLSAFRYIAERHAIYEEIPRLIAIGVGFSVLFQKRKSENDDGNTMRKRMWQSVAGILMLIVFVGGRLGSLGAVRGEIECPSLREVARTGACICNPFFAGQTGLKELLESKYGSACEEAVVIRESQGLR